MEHFFDALVAGDPSTAYQIWKPGASYEMKDFLADWGPEGYYGPVKSYKILKASAPLQANAVAVRVALSPFAPMPDASRCGKEPQDAGVEHLGADQRQVFQFPSIEVPS